MNFYSTSQWELKFHLLQGSHLATRHLACLQGLLLGGAVVGAGLTLCVSTGLGFLAERIVSYLSLCPWSSFNFSLAPSTHEFPEMILGYFNGAKHSVTIWFLYMDSLVAQMVKNLPAVQETWVPSLGWEDPLEEGMATYSSSLAWRIPMDRGAWQATVHGITKSWTWLSA